MAVDLHLHSNLSDGSDEPAEIVALAAAAELTGIALTDHDNVNGIDAARSAADKAGLRFIAGAELSVDWDGGAMHMLVYHIDPDAEALHRALSELQGGREGRNRAMVEKLCDLGIDITYDEVVAEADGSGIGRPHFAAVMQHKGYVVDIADAFDRYLATGRPGYVSRRRLEARAAVRLARKAGAVPVIAHPHTLGVSANDYSSAFATLVDEGLGGIEAYYAEYEPPLRRHLAAVCRDFDIVPTGGSDYHGSYKKSLSVGIGRGDLIVPDETMDLLEAEREKS